MPQSYLIAIGTYPCTTSLYISRRPSCCTSATYIVAAILYTSPHFQPIETPMLESKVHYPSRAAEACCTCAVLLSSFPSSPVFEDTCEKATPIRDRRLPCCARVICANCTAKNERFARYCPFCQISTIPSALPQGLRDPPAYSPSTASKAHDPEVATSQSITKLGECDASPPYSSTVEGEGDPRPDVVHHLKHPDDTIPSLSLLYRLPPSLLRTHNNLSSDHLIFARTTLRIPSSHYAGPSLSPNPVLSQENDEKRKKIRRFMVACKVSEYDVASLYLEQGGWEWETAVANWREDERWEKEHPLHPYKKGKGKGIRGSKETVCWARAG